MFLKNIKLTNFKCYEALYIDFSTGIDKHPIRKTSFLLGENGTGKSALLQAIAMVTGGSEALRSTSGIPADYIQLGKAFCEIEATIVTAQGEERFLCLRMQRGQAPWEIVNEARVSMLPMDAALRHTSRSYFTAGYGSGRRIDTGGLVSDVREYYNPRFAAIQSLFSRDAVLRPLDALIANAHQRDGEEGLEGVGTALNTFLPQSVRFCAISDDGQPVFSTPDGILPLALLSNGYQQTVAWVSDLLHHVIRVFGDYKNPLAARGLLLVDEIDLHLHPAWQRDIHSFLKAGLPNMQIIATTTSPLTASQAGRYELFMLKREKNTSVKLIQSIAVAPPMVIPVAGAQLHLLPGSGLQRTG
jgi:hypothetical protein